MKVRRRPTDSGYFWRIGGAFQIKGFCVWTANQRTEDRNSKILKVKRIYLLPAI